MVKKNFYHFKLVLQLGDEIGNLLLSCLQDLIQAGRPFSLSIALIERNEHDRFHIKMIYNTLSKIPINDTLTRLHVVTVGLALVIDQAS
jgi:hypothetical protein